MVPLEVMVIGVVEEYVEVPVELDVGDVVVVEVVLV